MKLDVYKRQVTKYDYDKHGNVISVTDAKGNETQYSVDLNDNVTKMTQANGGELSLIHILEKES